ncbi:[FeFe] hydrogenase H-cluster maturation GTPase HydF [Acidaminobacter sp. JC074]|uniref:[FeFe] hydrogenase H-cluster maturation GTPase HydF n=1 Tax=Acidaminobacter sp. JC074 TaxID=2530199 RepID=UPI001F0D3FC5|nr:[FeFe] hydrogenase H-cluster maturation GTPase HydF [Acidaminobacter sp. JC074]MCH4889562.1 [FeFe] hydrogenase H-cluster maturation GTPase HydF [Acidaminobacter sp. JC074]
MQGTPRANRPHIAIYGNRNAGKSSLLNAIIGQEISLVSNVKGTTTDPVTKTMELIPFGPVVFIDTAGLDDSGELGELRVERSKKILQRTDFAIYTHDINEVDDQAFKLFLKEFKRFNIPYMIVFNKIDQADDKTLSRYKELYPHAQFVSALKEEKILELKDELIKRLEDGKEEETLIGDLVPYGGKVILVVPIDSEAPKGRIILPQVQIIRDALDHGIKSFVVRDTELEDALKDMPDVDLVITDSQAFKEVNQIVPDHIPLTSFSIVFARHKGDLWSFERGIKAIKDLKPGSKVLISESCTHNHSHEDIGRVKIPKLLNKKLGFELDYHFKMGHDFPNDIKHFDMVIHCGSCMINKKTMLNRITMCDEIGVPITNYGIVLAYINDILEPSLEMFR